MKVLYVLASWLLVVFAQTDSTTDVAQQRLIYSDYGPETAARHLQRLNEGRSDTTLQYKGVLKAIETSIDTAKGTFDCKIKDATKEMNDYLEGIEGIQKPTKHKTGGSGLGK